MNHLRPLQDYKPGDRLQLNTLSSDEGTREKPFTEAIVLGFHPTAFRSLGAPKLSSRQGKLGNATRPKPNHWHVMVQDPATEEWLPAAIRDTTASIMPHIQVEHLKAQRAGDQLEYQVDELVRRVGDIASLITSIEQIEE